MPYFSPREYAKRFKSLVLPSEWVVILYCFAAMVLISVFRWRVPLWWAFLAGHFAIIVAQALLVGRTSPVLKVIRDFDLYLFIGAIFLMNTVLVHAIHPVDYDDVLTRWDRAIGGLALLKSMESITRPWLTDAMKVAWFSYYAIPLIPGIALWRRVHRDAYYETKLIYALGFLLCFVGYFALPARGVGWFERELDIAQPPWSESKVAGPMKKALTAIDADPRHTFPSGHVAVAALTIFLCVRNKLWAVSILAIPLSLAVIASTIYLRYHYVSDVIAGLALAAMCAPLGCWWFHVHSDQRMID